MINTVRMTKFLFENLRNILQIFRYVFIKQKSILYKKTIMIVNFSVGKLHDGLKYQKKNTSHV